MQQSLSSWVNPVEMKKITSGKLRAIGYDARNHLLQVQFDNGNTLQYNGIGENTWRLLSSSASPWSFYRDNIEEDFKHVQVSSRVPSDVTVDKNPLDDLFRKS